MSKTAIHIKQLSKAYKLGEYSGKTFAEEFKNLFRRKKALDIGLNDRENNAAQQSHVWALKDIDFELKEGEVVGVIGKNGAGKSTLLKVLSRITSPTEGEIRINGRIGALLEVGTGFQPDLTGRENVYLNGAILGMTKKEIEDKIDAIISFSGCAKYIDTPVKRYSSGMTVRLGFAVAAHLEPEILIIDEVLAVGDQEFQDQCIAKMKDFAANGKTVLFVSHNMASVKSLCDRGIVLERGGIAYDGSIDDAIQFYLKKQDKVAEDGKVPLGAGQINTGEAAFSKILLKGAEKGHINTALYGEDLQLSLEILAEEDMSNVNIEFLLHSSDNYKLGSANNVFEQAPLALKKGLNQVSVTLSNNLLPGTYSISASIANPSGTTFHHLQNFIDFKVQNIPLHKDRPYPFVWTNGFVRFKSSWETDS